MESHHVHSHVKEKHFKHYLFEFLMLFLAVFLGFLAENQRENSIEIHREKIFIISMSEDLKQDIIQLNNIIKERTIKNTMMYSLLYIINLPNPDVLGNNLYFYARWLPRTYRFYNNDRTFQQLKNGANWRLIRNEKVSDALQLYDQQVRTITLFIEQREELIVELLYPSLYKLFNYTVFESMVNGMGFNRPTNNPKLMFKDPESLNEFGNRIHFIKNANNYYIQNARPLYNKASKTLELLKQEYNLK